MSNNKYKKNRRSRLHFLRKVFVKLTIARVSLLSFTHVTMHVSVVRNRMKLKGGKSSLISHVFRPKQKS